MARYETIVTRSNNVAWFETRWKQLGGPPLVAEYRFHPTRKWQFDFAMPEKKIAIEIEGKGHAKWNRYHGDVEKYNDAARLGWRVFRVTFRHVADDDVALLESIIEESET